MREYPVIFSGPMVQAILEDRKFQTRRVIKPQPALSPNGAWWHWPRLGGIASWTADRRPSPESFMSEAMFERSPYQVGMRLWVRETWYSLPLDLYEKAFDATREACISPDFSTAAFYRADGETGFRVRPSIHMPRWASRIMLEVVNVGVERVDEISDEDARSEGYPGRQAANGFADPRAWFRCLWDEINGKKYPWSSNPFVWVIEFRRIMSNG